MATIKEFAKKKINNDFDLSVDDVAKRCYDTGRFQAYGLSNAQVKKVLNAVKDNGISPAFFAAYEASEGYNPSWGWLNHTTPQGNYLEDAKSVSRWLKKQSNDMSGKPAWIDYANYKDFVPASVKQKGNKDFKNMPKGTIGRAYIPGTAAATWEVYYPKGLKASYNGVQNYGAPLNDAMKTIEYWGGNIDSSGGGDSGGSDSGGGDSGGSDSGGGDSGGESTTITVKPDLSSVNDFFKKFIDDLIKKINKELKKDMNLKGLSKNLYSSKYLIIQKQLHNTYKPKPGKAFTDMLNKGKKDGSKELKNLVSKLEKDNTTITVKPDLSSVNDFFKKFIDDLIKKINKELKKDMNLKGLSKNLYSSKYLIIQKQLHNTYKPKPGKAFTDMLNKAKKDGSKELKNLVSKLEKDNTYTKETGGSDSGGGDSGGGDSGGGDSGGGDSGKGWYFPYKTDVLTVTSPQGYRWGRYHHGADVVAGSGGGIYAMHSGTVKISAESVPGWEVAGAMICIQNDKDDGYGGLFVQYEEFAPNSRLVNVGDKVKGGQRIATSGISGNSTGEHLHFSTNKKGKLVPARPGNWETALDCINLPNKAGKYKLPSGIKKPG